MRLVIFIGLGSFVGGVFRYLLTQLIHVKFLVTFPIGTLIVNILGSFLIGVVFGLSERYNFSVEWRLILATGILGGFTTFSAFSNETVGMMKEGQLMFAGIYVLGSVVLSLLVTFVGMNLVKLI